MAPQSSTFIYKPTQKGQALSSKLLAFICIAAFWVGPALAQGTIDRYGGLVTGQFEQGEYFRLEQDGPRWWFVTPDGGRFLSFGVNHMTWRGDKARGTGEQRYMDAVLAEHGTAEKWAEAACDQLRDWGFNTVGAWSVPEVNAHLPRTPILHLSQNYWSARWKEGEVPDFFSPAFQEYVNERAQAIKEQVGDPFVVGYFIDNELPWGPDHRNMPELFDGYVAMSADSSGKSRLVQFFSDRYESVESFNKVWRPRIGSWEDLNGISEIKARRRSRARADREAFTLEVARQYFKVTTDAIRAKDPGRLILGCRFMPYSVPKIVVQACGEYCDVISVNFYEQRWGAKLYFWWKKGSIDRMPQRMNLTAFHTVGKKPLMVTEFTSRLKAKGQNNWPPPYAIQPVVRTEKKRVARYEKQVMAWMRQPWFVGAHWFQHADQPKEGRGDGENSTFGLVTIDNEPYVEFVRGVAEVHPTATAAHANTK